MNYFMLDGKKIPMSEETAQSLREQTEKQHIPIVRIASLNKCDPLNRIILRLRESAEGMFRGLTDDVVVIDEGGDITNHWLADKEFQYGRPGNTYFNIKTLIEGNIP